MRKIPVLLLLSRNIDLTVLNQSPRFQRHHFFSITAMDYLENHSSICKTQTLLSAVLSNIKRVRAQYLLVHLGLAFYRYPVEFLTMVMETQSLYPQLRIGFDKGTNHAIQYLQLFAVPDPEITRLAGRIIQNRLTLEIDKEMAPLVGCLY